MRCTCIGPSSRSCRNVRPHRRSLRSCLLHCTSSTRLPYTAATCFRARRARCVRPPPYISVLVRVLNRASSRFCVPPFASTACRSFSIVVSSRFRSRPRSFRSFAASTPTNLIVAARRFFSVPRCFGSSPSTFDLRLSCCALHCVPQHQQQQLRCSAGIPAARAAEQWLVQRPGLLSCLMLLVPSRL